MQLEIYNALKAFAEELNVIRIEQTRQIYYYDFANSTDAVKFLMISKKVISMFDKDLRPFKEINDNGDGTYTVTIALDADTTGAENFIRRDSFIEEREEEIPVIRGFKAKKQDIWREGDFELGE